MKLKTREDIEATMDQVFEALSDFDGMEHSALRYGADIKRLDDLSGKQAGMMWHAEFSFRNRKRTAVMELTKLINPQELELISKVSGIEATINVDLMPLSKNRTRMIMSLDLRPKSIPARLLVQSMKIARVSILRRFRKRVADYALSVEDRYRTGGAVA